MYSEIQANTLKENWKILLSKEIPLISISLACSHVQCKKENTCGNRVSQSKMSVNRASSVLKCLQFSHAFSLNSFIGSYRYIQIRRRNCIYGHLRSWRSGTSLYTISCIVRSGLQDNIKPCYQLAPTKWETDLSERIVKYKYETFFSWKCCYLSNSQNSIFNYTLFCCKRAFKNISYH